MNSNLFITKDTPLKEVEVGSYSVDSNIPPDDYYRIIKGAEWYLFNRHFLAAAYQNKLIFIRDNLKPNPTFDIKGYKFNLSDEKLLLNSIDHNYVLSSLVYSALKRKIWSLNYDGPESQKFFKRMPYKRDFFNYHEAFFAEVEIFNDGRVGIWLDPSTKWKFPMSSFLLWAKNRQFKFNDIEKYLINKDVKCPSVSKNLFFKAKIKKVEDIPIGSYEFTKDNGQRATLLEYWNNNEPHKRWLQRNGIQLELTQRPTILVQLPNIKNLLPYPPSVLEIIIDLLDSVIPDNAFREKKSLHPKARLKETILLYDHILANGVDLGAIKLRFERKLFNWKAKGFNYGKIISLSPPSLVFGNNGICIPYNKFSDPNIKNAMFKFGPFTRKDTIKVSYIGPESETEHFSTFNDYLNVHAKKLNLAEFILYKTFPVDRIHPDRYMRVCHEVGRNSDDSMTIVILPHKKPTKTYYASKRGLGKYLVKSQMIQWKTYMDMLKNSAKPNFLSYANYNIALKLYGRHLSTGESIWHLNEPAGGLNPNKTIYFMGFDVSRNPETRKEAAAYAAVCDIYGRILYKNVIDTHRGEKVQAEILSDWFFELATSTYDDIGEEKNIDGIYLFKDGPIPSSQVKDYQKGAELARERLLEEHIMNKSSDIKIMAVIKRGLHRFYGNKEKDYRIPMMGLVRDTRKAIVVTSKPRIGTASTIRLDLSYQINKDMNIDQVCRIFNDLRYLDWSSLFQQPKTILPLHIVQNLAILSKEDIYVPYDPR